MYTSADEMTANGPGCDLKQRCDVSFAQVLPVREVDDRALSEAQRAHGAADINERVWAKS